MNPQLRRKAGKLAFVVLFLTVLGWLIGATIISQSNGVHGPDPAIAPGQTYAVARICHRHGPVSTHGFGFWHQCAADLHYDGAAEPAGEEIVGFLGPADIGRKVALEREGTGRRSHHVRAAGQPFEGWAWLTLPFAPAWLYLVFRVARPLARDLGKDLEAIKLDEPTRDVTVVDTRKSWLNWKVQLVLLMFATIAAVRSTPWAFEGFGGHQILSLVGWGVIVLLAGNFLRRFVFGPWVTVSPDGLSFRGRRLGWAEVQELRLTRHNVLVVTPRTGRTRRIGRFGDEGGTRLHHALSHFGEAPYSHDRADV
ncbi:DUF6346 domain-containing protein [Lentzea californiensis]|uniref:DUF6346 domain-containing protein n=1 Tax=Lentzea californiensis TaxID=438851 RepID=UPI0021669596|nr:DUF6346 domain-containing protein [Lentzea californiensis]MCR3751302.1 hypothetical protein [Lentzea californiensis]